jgi:VanZ family protein
MKHRAALKLAVNRIVPLWLRISAWLTVAAWAAAITVLSSMTPSQLQQIAPFDFWDKAAHFLAFAAGAVALSLALRWSTAWPWKRIVLIAVAAVALFGAIDEYHQTFTPHRSGADLSDWTADMLGALTGALATAFFHARTTRTHRLAPAGD